MIDAPNIRNLKDIFEMLSHLTVVLGLPIAIFQYRRSKLREQADREYGTYNALDEKYLDFQALCFQHPELDIFDIPDADPKPLGPDERKQELIAFTTLISIFERAYLMYHDQSNKVKTAQWSGWDEYVTSYCERDNFRNAWEVSGETFDRNFEKYVEEIIERRRAGPAAPLRRSHGDLLQKTYMLLRVTSVTDQRYLSALRLASQYGWAGGTFNTNELSLLLETSGPSRLTEAYLLMEDSGPVGIAIISAIASARLVVIHEMAVAQSVIRDALFGQFWMLLSNEIAQQQRAVDLFVAEVPRNEPRHLKTEVFARGLVSVGFAADKHSYYLPSGFNYRKDPAPAQLYVSGVADVSRQSHLAIVHALYFELYRLLWVTLGSAPGEINEQIRFLESQIQDEAAEPRQ